MDLVTTYVDHLRYLSDVLERPELANKEQREWAAVEAYVAAANVAKMWA